MNLIGLLSFYDEPVVDLALCVEGLHDAGCTEIVALDGAYRLFPDGKPASHPNQHAAIVLTARKFGMGCTLHVPRGVWEGNEVQKRTALFALGWAVAKPGDWFWVQDADMVAVEVPKDLKDRLEATVLDVAEVEILDTVVARMRRELGEHAPDSLIERFAMRSLFRAQPIHLETNHITYVTADGRLLWGWDGGEKPIEPALDLTDCLVVEHRPDTRSRERQLAKLGYYAQRDAARVERGACACGMQAVRLVPTDWAWTDVGPTAAWREACDRCAQRLERVSRRQLRAMGIDPDSVEVENRNGHRPAPVKA